MSATHRERPPRSREGGVTTFRVGEAKGYLTVNRYPDGRPCEVFLKVAKEGTLLAGVLDTLAIIISHALQHGVPVADIATSLIDMRYEPWGETNDPEIPNAESISDYIGKRLALDYMTADERVQLLHWEALR